MTAPRVGASRMGSSRAGRAAGLFAASLFAASLFAALSLLAAAPAGADRTVTIGTIDRLRVEGAYKVTVRTGVAPGLVIGGDGVAAAAIDVRSDGGLLAIRAAGALTGSGGGNGSGNGAGGRPRAVPVTITVSTPALRAVTAIGGATIAVGPMKGQAVDLAVSGTGTLTVASVDGDRLTATLIGNGGVTIAGGRVGSARLVNNGGGTLDASGVQVGDLLAHQDGAGAIRASARFTAQVNNSGLGSIAVAGSPRCAVRSPAGGAVTCGASGDTAR